MIEFLTHEEVCELTGSHLKAGQINNLKQNNIRHTIKVSGWPCVTVAAIVGPPEKRSTKPEEPVWTLDLSKIK
ncbi:DUF4224 domain-containing protein [Pseudomonas gingeri]|uniref:DUF4224 domain-containing protein n=1 Tax=Pseudomonas gingeri TaxID=117681 RepID=UPI0015A2C208|nr:DUF4224 domain-containing protein [Pseudomonas gingeri]NWA24079.1 DUF4224 domain-containing protein [Pseudomonas gingeri]